MSTEKIDTLVMVIADKEGGKSNLIRAIFEEFELRHFYDGYPKAARIRRKYHVHPDIDLLYVCHHGTKGRRAILM
jgi:hypothetical protein